jgi:hypothetical protein
MCLADPISDQDGRSLVGKVVDRLNARVEVDCEEVFGGEAISEKSVVATDGDGVAQLHLDNIGECLLQRSSTVEVKPQPPTLLAFTAGEVICRLVMSNGDRSFTVDDEPLTVGSEPAAFIITMSPGDGGNGELTVIEGFVSFDPPESACRAIVGPGQTIPLTATYRAVDVVDLGLLSSPVVDAVRRVGANPTLPVADPELLPGLQALIEARAITLVLDGEMLAANAADSRDVDVFEALIGAEVRLDSSPGAFEVVDTRLDVLPSVDFGSQVFQVEALPPVAVADVEQMLESDNEILSVAQVPVLFDPAGGAWSVVYDEQRTEIGDQLQVDLAAALRTGAYASFYQQTFGQPPDYALLQPELLGGREPCR